jgi:sugar phosphate permease
MAGAIFWNLIFALSGSLTAFIVVWCCCRYFLSMGWGGLTKTIGSWYSSDKNGRVMGAISISFQSGGAIAALFAGFLVANGASWQGVFVYPALVLSVIWVWAFFASRAKPADVVPGAIAVEGESAKKQLADYGDEETPPVTVILKTLIKMPIYRQLLVFSFLTTLLRSVFLIWTPKFLFDIGQGASAAILKSAVFPALGVAGTVFIGWYTDHYARNGDRARMMWMMLSVLVLCTFAISVLSAAESPNYNLILFFPRRQRLLPARPLFDEQRRAHAGYRRSEGRWLVHRDYRRHGLYRRGDCRLRRGSHVRCAGLVTGVFSADRICAGIDPQRLRHEPRVSEDSKGPISERKRLAVCV